MMKVEVLNGNIHVNLDEKDRQDYLEYPDAVLDAVIENFSADSKMMAIQVNEQLKQLYLMNLENSQMKKIIKQFTEKYQAKLYYIAEEKTSKTIVFAVEMQDVPELKSGLYEPLPNNELQYSALNENPAIQRILRCLQ